MKLRVKFLQLPVLFDAERLAAEVAAIPESSWRKHPKGFAGNDALTLITEGGDPNSDARRGRMEPTPHLKALPYLMQVLETLGGTWGRSRLMRLSGEAEATAHIDSDYYWREHHRVHVPIVTQPTVRFVCGDQAINMQAGECWVFDTWSLHSVHNDAVRERIHLVADTVGSDAMLTLMETGRSPGQNRPDWAPRRVPFREGHQARLAFEAYNAPVVMSPWELRDHLGFLMSEVQPGHQQAPIIGQILNRLRVNWHALWARSADGLEARGEYLALLDGFWPRLEAAGVMTTPMRNGLALGVALRTLIFDTAVMDEAAAQTAPRLATPPPPPLAPSSGPSVSPSLLREAAAKAPPAPRTTEAEFDRPVFIVSPPRSGSSLLFETLARAPRLFTVGGESHRLMEAVAALNPAGQDWTSNRATAADATSEVTEDLRRRFMGALRDRDSAAPAGRRVRMLEKTPKNALRIPFLAAVFPDARFVYLHRDPAPTLASMIEGWLSGQFRTYPNLPGWSGPDWSFLLTPGWRTLNGAPLNRIVATQWTLTTRVILDDLEALPPDRWASLSYEAFLATPQDVIRALCAKLELDWDQSLAGALPHSRHTLTPPDPEKWRARQAEVEAVAAFVAAEDARARAVLARHGL